MAKLSKIWGSREIKQGSNPSRRGPRLNLIGVPHVQVYLNGEYFGTVEGTSALTAIGLVSGARTASVAFGQVQVLSATGIKADSTVGAPLLQIAQARVDLVANNISSGTRVGSTIFGQVHALAGQAIHSDSRTASPAMAVIFHLAPTGIHADSRTGQPEVKQIHVLVPGGIIADSETGTPSISVGANAFGKVQIDGVWRNVVECQIVINDEWKTVTEILTVQSEDWKALGV